MGERSPQSGPATELDPPGLDLVTRLTVFVDPPVEAGTTGRGMRRIIPITGGTAVGPGFEGTIEVGGSDVQLIRPDDADLRWLERDLFIATGARFPDRVQIDVFHVT